MILSGLLLLLSATPAAATDDYIPAAWRGLAEVELSKVWFQPDFKGTHLDDGLAQLKLGPFETLDFIRSDQTDPRATARLQQVTFNIVRADSCVGVVVVRTRRGVSGSSQPEAMALPNFAGPVACERSPVDDARALAVSPRSVCVLKFPVVAGPWNTILVDTPDRGTLVIEWAQIPGEAIDPKSISTTPLADWAARTKRGLREGLELDDPLPPVSHDAPEGAVQAAQTWLQRRYPASGGKVPVLAAPTREFVLSEVELARYAESNEVDPGRFDADPRFAFPVEGAGVAIVWVQRNRDEFARKIDDREGDYLAGATPNAAEWENFQPPVFRQYGHVAMLNMTAAGLYYHIIAPYGVLIGRGMSVADSRKPPVPVAAFADSIKIAIRERFQNQ